MRLRLIHAAILASLGSTQALAQSSAPTLSSLSPSTVPAGAAVTITLNGTNLVSGTNVLVSGNIVSNTFCFSGPCPIAYIGNTQMTVLLAASAVANPGSLTIQVQSPPGATSNGLTLTITPGGSSNNPVPSISSLSPSSAAAGGAAFTLTVNGSNFVPASAVQWNGSARTAKFVSGTQLTASISASDIADARTVAVTAVSPAPGGGTSGSVIFVVNPGVPTGSQGNRVPTIIWMLPVNTTARGAASSLGVYGANFVQGSTVQWNGANRPTTYVNSNQLQVAVSPSDIANAGSAAVKVVNPAPGGGPSAEWVYPLISPGVTTFAAGPQPVGLAPVAAAVDPVLGRIYVVHRGVFRDIGINSGTWPSDVVTVIDQKTGSVITTIGIGGSVNGEGQGIAADSTRHRVYVTNADDNTVSVIDGTTNTTIATTAVDKNPKGIGVDPDRGIVYVAAANVTLLDAGTGAALASVPVGGAAGAIAVDGSTHLAYALVNSIPATVAAVDGGGRSVRTPIALPSTIYTWSAIAVDPGARVYASDYNTGTISAIDITGSTPVLLNGFSGAAQYAEAVAVDPASHLVYVVSSSSGAVGVFNSNGTKQKAISVLRAPTAIAMDRTSGHAYVVNTYSDSLTVVDTGQLAVTATIPLGVQPMGLAFDPTARRLYAANNIADAVSAIDAAEQKPVASWTSVGGTWSVAVDPVLRQVYAVNSSDGGVSIFSSIDGSLKAKVNAGATGASAAAVNYTTGMVYISSGTLGGTVTAIDGRTNQVAARISVGDAPVGIAIDESVDRVYVANQHSGTISVIDGGANQVVATWKPPLSNVWKLAVDPALKRLYASIPPPTTGSFTGLEVLDSSTGAFVAQVGGQSAAAEDVAVNPKTHHVFLSDAGNGTVTVIDGSTNTVLKSLVTGSAAVALAVDAASGLVYASNAFDATIGVFSDQPSGPPAPVVGPGGIASGASFSTAALTAGAIGVVFGNNFAGYTIVAPGVPWPTTLAGVSVLVNGVGAPLYFVSANQIDFQFPWQFLGQTQVSVVVVVNGVGSTPQTVKLVPAGPDIFTMNTQGQGAIQIANTAILAAPAGSVPGVQARPAMRGEYLTIYCTGLGDVKNRPVSGAAAPANPLANTIATTSVSIGGVSAPAIFSGLSPGFVGLYQVNVQVPLNAPAGNAVPVVLSIGGAASNTVTIAVQ